MTPLDHLFGGMVVGLIYTSMYEAQALSSGPVTDKNLPGSYCSYQHQTAWCNYYSSMAILFKIPSRCAVDKCSGVTSSVYVFVLATTQFTGHFSFVSTSVLVYLLSSILTDF